MVLVVLEEKVETELMDLFLVVVVMVDLLVMLVMVVVLLPVKKVQMVPNRNLVKEDMVVVES